MRPSVLMNHTVRDREIFTHTRTHTHGHSHCADPASLSLIISHKCITAAVQTLKQANYDARTFTLGARTGTSAAASGVILQQLRRTREYVGCKFVKQTSTLAHTFEKPSWFPFCLQLPPTTVGIPLSSARQRDFVSNDLNSSLRLASLFYLKLILGVIMSSFVPTLKTRSKSELLLNIL